MYSIQGSLEKRSGQVVFCCGNSLLRLFQQHWPDFVIFETGALGAYVSYLYRDIERDDPVSVLVEQHSLLSQGAASFKSTYVRQGFSLELHKLTLVLDVPTSASLDPAFVQTDVQRLYDRLVSIEPAINTLDGFLEENGQEPLVPSPYQQAISKLSNFLKEHQETTREYRARVRSDWLPCARKAIACARQTKRAFERLLGITNEFVRAVPRAADLGDFDPSALASYTSMLHVAHSGWPIGQRYTAVRFLLSRLRR